ncbi:sensor domain-containing protein [Nocardia jiangxiensis]|uniref:sensor domain-containing protein n=1 Tax=Nocardia jiangxiensis TaxID=282685 RepID=UPI001FDEC8C0|nr:sensor domain-containing protein [Nocardia jiangxiensis]
MNVPEAPDPRPRRFGRGGVAGCAVLGLLLTACGSTVSGHPDAESQQATVIRHIAADLGSMLPTAAQFPDTYPPVVLSGSDALGADADLRGIPSGATVDPPGCADSPPTDPQRIAATVGTDDDTRASITVELIRTTDPLARLRTLLQQCGTVRAQHGPITNTVVTQLDPAAPVNADDSLAWRRTVSGQRGGPGLTRSMRTLAAQIGDVRIIATYLTFGDDKPDMTALDQVFTATVQDVGKR